MSVARNHEAMKYSKLKIRKTVIYVMDQIAVTGAMSF